VLRTARVVELEAIRTIEKRDVEDEGLVAVSEEE
jgi:hypothetical protein